MRARQPHQRKDPDTPLWARVPSAPLVTDPRIRSRRPSYSGVTVPRRPTTHPTTRPFFGWPLDYLSATSFIAPITGAFNHFENPPHPPTRPTTPNEAQYYNNGWFGSEGVSGWGGWGWVVWLVGFRRVGVGLGIGTQNDRQRLQ